MTREVLSKRGSVCAQAVIAVAPARLGWAREPAASTGRVVDTVPRIAIGPLSDCLLALARTPMPTPLTDVQLAAQVSGYRVAPTTLGELLDERPTLLVFLRHFG